MEDVKSCIRENLIRLRKENKFTQQELAKKLNYSDKAISRWELGESLPDISVLIQVCELFNVEFDWLIHKHEVNEKIEQKAKNQTLSMKIAIACLIVVSCFSLAMVFFVYSLIFNSESTWKIFLWAIPASTIGLMFICRKWLNYVAKISLLSVCMWSLLACIYFVFYPANNIWALFFIGIPVQAILILLYFIKERKI